MKLTINFKRTLAVCLAVILFILSCAVQTNSTNAANTNVNYKVFNAQTGDYLRSYTLNSLRSENNSRAIIDTDDREIDWSKSGTVKLMTITGYIGTGFVVDEHTVATAGHCLYLYGTPWKVLEILLFDSTGKLAMTATPVEYHVPVNYINNNQDPETYNKTSDYGLITVKEDLSDYMCYNLGVISDPNHVVNKDINITGFPGDNNYFSKHTMLTASGSILNCSSEAIEYNADTIPGDSGSPVYMTETRCGRTYNTVIGINAYTYEEANGTYHNYGTRIDTNILHFFISNENLLY